MSYWLVSLRDVVAHKGYPDSEIYLDDLITQNLVLRGYKY